MRKLTPRSSVETLKREAKRWLKALRADDPDARARLDRAIPSKARDLTLRDVQHALAIEYGYDGWAALIAAAADIRQAPGDAGQLTPLLLAASEGDVQRLAELLEAHPELIDERGTLPGHMGLRTALHFGNAHEAVVRLLLERGADPNIRDEGDNAYPLHFVAERLELETIRLLVEHGADPVGEGDMHELAIIGWATCFRPPYLNLTPAERERRRRLVVDYLLAHGGRHNIYSAVAMGDVDAIRSIVTANPQALERPMDAANHRRHPIHLAVVESRPESLVALADLGADLEARDVAGLTALDQAALLGERVMADLLIARGATIRLPAALALDRDVESVLSENPHAVRPGGEWETLIVRAAEQSDSRMLETLIRYGASVDTVDREATAVDNSTGYTALHAAAIRGNRAAVDVLLRNGASVTARDGRYFGTPAGWASYGKHPDIADRILEGPIDPFDAILFGRIDRLSEIVARDPGALNRRMGALLPREPGPDEWTKAWWTPLAMAVTHGYTAAVRELLRLGADAGVRDPEQRTLREIALGAGHEEIAALLAAAV